MGKMILNLKRPVSVIDETGRYQGVGSEFIDVLQDVTVQPWVFTDKQGQIRSQGGETPNLHTAYHLQSIEIEPGFSRFVIGFGLMAARLAALTPGTVIVYVEGRYVRSKRYFRVNRLVTAEEQELLAARKMAPVLSNQGNGRGLSQAGSAVQFPSVETLVSQEDELAAAPGRF